jgi:hypothetical protein
MNQDNYWMKLYEDDDLEAELFKTMNTRDINNVLNSMSPKEVENYQREKGLKVDGIIGPETKPVMLTDDKFLESKGLKPSVQRGMFNPPGFGQQSQSKPPVQRGVFNPPGFGQQPSVSLNQQKINSLEKQLSELKTRRDQLIQEIESEKQQAVMDEDKLRAIVGLGLEKQYATDELGIGKSKTAGSFTDEEKQRLKEELGARKTEILDRFNKAVQAYDKVKNEVIKGDESKLEEANKLYAKAREIQSEAVAVRIPQNYLPKLETVQSAIDKVKNTKIQEKLADAQVQLASAKVQAIPIEQQQQQVDLTTSQEKLAQSKRDEARGVIAGFKKDFEATSKWATDVQLITANILSLEERVRAGDPQSIAAVFKSGIRAFDPGQVTGADEKLFAGGSITGLLREWVNLASGKVENQASALSLIENSKIIRKNSAEIANKKAEQYANLANEELAAQGINNTGVTAKPSNFWRESGFTVKPVDSSSGGSSKAKGTKDNPYKPSKPQDVAKYPSGSFWYNPKTKNIVEVK